MPSVLPPSLYDVLQVSRQASAEEIRAAFKHRALVVHPDKGGTKEAFQNVLFAFETLTDRARRASYDRRLDGEDRCYATSKSKNTLSKRSSCSQAPVGRPSTQGHCPPHASQESEAQGQARRPTNNPLSPAEVGSRKERNPTRHSCVSSSCSQRPKHPGENIGEAKGHDYSPGSKHVQSLGHCSVGGQKRQRDCTGDRQRLPRTRQAQQRRILVRVFELLKSLSAARRREIMQTWLSQSQRIALEAFIISLKPGVSAQQTALQLRGSSADADVSTSEDSSSDEESNGESFGPEPLALCDGGICSETEDAPGSDDEVEPYCDEPCPVAESERQRNPRKSPHGLFITTSGNKYLAKIVVDTMNVRTKSTELSTALDFAVFLTTLKENCLSSLQGAFGNRFKDALARGFEEHRMMPEDIGLRFCISCSKAFWLGRHILQTPLTTDLEQVLHAREVLSPYQGAKGRRGQVMLLRMGLIEMQSTWNGFCERYLAICAAAGQSRERVARRISALEAARRPVRDAQIEWWNRRRMASEERRQRGIIILERRSVKRERKAMRVEDAYRRKFERRPETRLARLERRLWRWLQRWKRCSVKWAAQMQRKLTRKRVEKARQLAAARKAARDEARRLKAARAARWRAINRRDLTLSDLLDGHWAR